ncbi:MAG: DUF302 domain-containing protein [Cyanobacteria bacterium P01_C01_bin.120]
MKKIKSLLSLLLGTAAVLCIVIASQLAPVAADAQTENNGLVQLSSNFSVSETGDRLEALLEERRLTLMARIDHAQNAASVGKELRPTELFIFGNPAVGTPLMQCNQSVAIDLPQKMLIWEDASEQVQLAYNDPEYLLARHQLEACEPVIERVSQVLEDIAMRVAGS